MQFKWRVKKSERGISLENFIYKKLGDWSHSRVKRAIDGKRAFVNGRNVFLSKWHLKPNDAVLFVPSGAELAQRQKNGFYYVDVLYEDAHIIAANKPAFCDHEQFARAVGAYLKRQNKGRGFPYVGQMHRLDRETTGVMVFTKKKIANTLAEQFRDHSIRKFYVAIVQGAVEKQQGIIRLPIEKGRFKEGRKVRVATSSAAGRKAVTHFRVQERYDQATVLKIEITTGRTHQIRIHLSHIGHPLVGDKLYGNEKGLPFKRHALHAERLDFIHPISGRNMKVTAPLPADMRMFIERLR